MSDFGVFGPNAIDRVQFFQKTEKILKYLRELAQDVEGEDREVLDRASEVITKLVHERMNQGEGFLKKIMETDDD